MPSKARSGAVCILQETPLEAGKQLRLGRRLPRHDGRIGTRALPTDAIVSNGNDHYIFVETQANTYKQVQVRIGTTDQNYTEVIPLEEVLSEQKVVVKGAYYLLSELTKGEGEHHD